MAEVEINTPAAALKLDGKDGLVRRNSTGNFNTQPTTPKILPHYLRASTGSCHDFCKNGFAPHVAEAKERNPFTERFAQRIDKTQYQARKEANSIPRKKKLVLSSKVSPGLNIQTPYKCELIMEEVPKSTKNVRRASDLKLKPVKTKVISLTAPSRLSIQYTELILPKVLGVLQASSNNRRISESKTIKETVACKTSSKSALSVSPKASMKRSSPEKLPSLSAPRRLSRRLSEIIMPKVQTNSASVRNSEIEMIKKKVNSEDPQKVFPVNDENGADFAATKEPVVEVVPEKILFFVEPEAKNDSLTCHSPPSADQNEVQATSSDIKTINCNNDVTNATQSPPTKSKDETNAEKGICNAESPQSTLCSLDCTSSDQIEPIEQEQRPRRMRRVVSEDTISSLQKVKFAQGKEVNAHFDNNSPRKVKFRQGSVLENQNGKAENRVRRLRRLVSDVVTDKVKTGPGKKVVLRHQEVKGRMVSSRSFNNVIEETASKLVESRKSKVKALVGAFETVISLQDRKKSKEITSAG